MQQKNKASSEFVVRTFFKMLGWATSINKENEFENSFRALGILIGLSEMKLLKVRFKAILKSGRLGRSEGQRIRGHLLFAE